MAWRIGALVAVACAIGVLWWTGAFAMLSDADRLRELLVTSGVWGYGAYVLAFALLEPFGVPGIVFIIPATLVWPAWVAFGLSMLGASCAGVVGFSFARWIGRDWVAARIPTQLHAFDERLSRRGFTTTVVVRMVFFLAPPAHWVLGLSRVRFVPFALGSAVGYLPWVAALTFLGVGAIELWRANPRLIWLVVAAAGAIWLAARRLRGAASHGGL